MLFPLISLNKSAPEETNPCAVITLSYNEKALINDGLSTNALNELLSDNVSDILKPPVKPLETTPVVASIKFVCLDSQE